MRLLVEFSHPAQVHKFKNVLRELIEEGHQILILSRKKDVMTELLDAVGLPHRCISKARNGLFGMAVELLQRELLTFWQVWRFRPDILFSAHSVAITHSGWLFRVPTLVHEDTEFGTLQQKLYIPFATRVVTTTSYMKDWGATQVRINSLEPLAYLHPNYFKPDAKVLETYGLSMQTPYAVVRFVAWKAAHDRGYRPPTTEEREQVLASLGRLGIEKVVFTSELEEALGAPVELIRPQPTDLHHLMAFAAICVGDGITVANEAAVLGIPTVLWNPLRGGHTVELERYGLVRRVARQDETLRTVEEILRDRHSHDVWQQRRKRLLSEKSDMNRDMINLLLELGGQGDAV